MKRIGVLGLVVIFLLAAIGMALPASAESGYVRGDADADGIVSILDATAIQRVLVELPVSSFDERAADVDGDGVNILDNKYLIGETVTVTDPTTATTEPTRPSYELPLV